MVFNIMAPTIVGLALSFLSGARAEPCPSGTVAVNVTSTADIQNLTAALACTGQGAFDITWYSSLVIMQRIEVSSSKDVTVAGTGFPSIRGVLADDDGADAIVDAGAVGGLFKVSDGSTLRLSGLLLEGGHAEQGGAVNLNSSSSLVVFGCTFANNSAADGGNTICLC